ncbi:MAG TPA: S46 family peptidase [Polyangiaceae bacterium]|jgi:hypothetical protein
MRTRSIRLLSLASLAAFTGACGGEAPPPAVAPPPPTTVVAPPPAASVAPEAPRPKVAFENPGGMWMPNQMGAHAAKLRELGLQIDPAQLADPTSDTLSAIVSLGGCSASFVSPDGLVITNHHCVQGALQYNSTPSEDLIKNGFLARTRTEEKSAGPTARVYVTRAVTDVTGEMTRGIDAIKDDIARHKKLEERQKEVVAACEKGRPEMRCTVASFYEGAEFFRVEQLEVRDVRLVYAPPAGIGNYGGEIDNWRWPRHAGDFSFYRAYVGKDGQPADYSPDNVPYHAAHFLKVASTPLEEGDLVMVAGYPGRTYSLKTRPEVDEAVEWSYPRRQRWCEDYLGAMEKVTTDKEVAIKANSLVRGLNNALTNYKGQLEGLVKGGIAKEKADTEASLAAWIAADPRRKAQYGTVLSDIARAEADAARTRDEDADVREISGMPRLVGAATTIVRMAEERAKKDEERHPDYQKRNWRRLEQSQAALEKQYNPTLDRTLLVTALRRARDDGHAGRALAAIVGSAKPSDELIAKKVDAIYAATKIESKEARLDLLAKATPAELRRSADPIVKLAVALRPMLKAAEDRDDAMAGRMALLKPRYIAALREHAGKEIAPDANGTLRLTYGTVRGYSPSPGAPAYRPFTALSEVVAKSTGKEPFDAPRGLLEAVQAHKLGPYVDEHLKDVPVDFLSDLHITGGNSGSATLNAKGELVGLAFDGNYEAMASDWVFMPSVTRSIHVDIRYVEWVMDAVGGADALLKELGKTPAIE